ncbi:MAG: hypothetical protein IKY04_04665 [Lachnospiraceae bacterium]|nr:hypothetical protein [Lachnospiraceae bacterium]MBR4993521.1 hypothetical protein [Lachnospiraceae bacterium]
MNEEIKMSVSSMTRKDDNKAIYVMFEDGAKKAEFVLPEGKLLNNEGFTDEETAQLKDYVLNSQDEIYSVAKKVNPMKGFMGVPQGE